MPATSRPSVRAASIASSASSAPSPNFEPSCAVAIAWWVSASTPGVSRTSTRRTPAAARALRLVGRVEHDERAGLRGGPQLLVRLVVAVEEQAVAGEPGRARERELAERRDVGADALLGEHAQQLDVRERLRPVDDQRVRRGVAVGARLRAQRLLAVDEERRPVLVREPRDGHAAERRARRPSIRALSGKSSSMPGVCTIGGADPARLLQSEPVTELLT